MDNYLSQTNEIRYSYNVYILRFCRILFPVCFKNIPTKCTTALSLYCYTHK